MNLKTIVAASAIALCTVTIAAANEDQGKVTHVRDADTIEVYGVPIIVQDSSPETNAIGLA